MVVWNLDRGESRWKEKKNFQNKTVEKFSPHAYFISPLHVIFFSRTAESESGGGDDAGLYHCILLSGEGMLQQTEALKALRVDFDQKISEQTGSHVERRDDPDRQIKLHDDETEEEAQDKADDKSPHSQLLSPWRNLSVLEHPLDRQVGFAFSILVIRFDRHEGNGELGKRDLFFFLLFFSVRKK